MPAMHATDRRDALLRLVRDHGYVNVADAARAFAVDTSTIRRDLGRMRELGLIERSHGGAIPIRDEDEVPFLEKVGRQVDEKRAVAKAVAALIQKSSTVLLDAGSTCFMVARELATLDGLTVITPDIRIAAELISRPDIRLIVPGGEAVPSTSTVLGQEAIDMVRRLHVDVAIMGVDAVDVEGASNLNSVVVPFKRAMLGAASRTILAADSSKLGTRRLIRVASLDEFTQLVTDERADEAELARYPLKVIRAPLTPEKNGLA